jgi:hypothetical protein
MYNPNAKRRRIKPYARPTSFDYNVRYDIRQYQDVKYNRIKKPFFRAASNDEVFRVMEGELLAKSNQANARYNDKELHVFSFANGLTAPESAPVNNANSEFLETTANGAIDQREVRRAVLGTIQYMGVAVTEFSPARDVYEQGFVATIAGLNTLYNNGTETVYPGQTVCMDLPVLRQNGNGNHFKRALQQGVPRDKLQFILRPHQDMLDDYKDLTLVNRFIIGTAISYSRPGDTVDVILHRMNYTSTSVGGDLGNAGVSSSGGSDDARDSVVGQFLGRLVDGDDGTNNELSARYNGVLNYHKLVNRLQGAEIQKAIAEARGSTGFRQLVRPDGAIARFEEEERIKYLLENEVRLAAIATATGSKLGSAGPTDAATAKAFINKAAAEARTGGSLAATVTGGGSADQGKLLAILYDDVNKSISDKIAAVGVPTVAGSPEYQILAAGSLSTLFNRMIIVADKIDEEFGNTTVVGQQLLGAGSVLDLLEDQGKFSDKALATDISARTLLKGSATSTSAPGISAAVGKGASTTKKKRK